MRFKNILGLSNEAAEIFDLRERSIMEYFAPISLLGDEPNGLRRVSRKVSGAGH
jgi:hypothetical protein